MKTYRYGLEKGSKKHVCPKCNKKQYVRYVDIETSEYLPYQFGRCERVISCQYHINPYKSNDFSFDVKPIQVKTGTSKKESKVNIDFSTFTQTLQGYEANRFIQNLLTNSAFPFDASDVRAVIELYKIGTIVNGEHRGAVTFPCISVNKDVRAVQVKKFDKDNHTTYTTYLHSIIIKNLQARKEPLPEWLVNYDKQDLKADCLFGEHLLNDYPNNPIYLVEAAKTAVIGTLYFGLPATDETIPIWLATLSESCFTESRVSVLKGRSVTLFPDLSKGSLIFRKWQEKAIQYAKTGISFSINEYLEETATDEEKESGFDIADFLIKHDWRNFRKQEYIHQKEEQSITTDNTINADSDISTQIKQIEAFFKDFDFSSIDVLILNKCTKIIDLQAFVNSYLCIIKAQQNRTRAYYPYLHDLRNVINLLRNNIQ